MSVLLGAVCVNLQWQLCAIRGQLHGQHASTMMFSIPPKSLDVGIFDHPSRCVGDCSGNYAVSDVYFAEVCVLNHVCKNKRELFELDVGTAFHCDFDRDAFMELRTLLSGD